MVVSLKYSVLTGRLISNVYINIKVILVCIKNWAVTNLFVTSTSVYESSVFIQYVVYVYVHVYYAFIIIIS